MRMLETARYTPLVAGIAKQVAIDMSKVLDVEMEPKHEKVHIGEYAVSIGWLPKAATVSVLEEVYIISKAQALLAMCSTSPGSWFTAALIDYLGRIEGEMAEHKPDKWVVAMAGHRRGMAMGRTRISIGASAIELGEDTAEVEARVASRDRASRETGLRRLGLKWQGHAAEVGHPPQFFPKGGSDGIPSHGGNNGNTSSKGRRILYTHSDDEDDNDDNGTLTNDELHFISTTSSPRASTSSSSSFSNKVHAKGSPKKDASANATIPAAPNATPADDPAAAMMIVAHPAEEEVVAKIAAAHDANGAGHTCQTFRPASAVDHTVVQSTQAR
ncbi:hypothetical protein L7F22_049567 [Adiantum nelumboides]|nr:hypothetical protein [Adiantum nelumboides]